MTAIPLEAVLERWPTLRQSLLARFDDCPLSAFFDLTYGDGWSTHPQAMGTLFHRFASEALRTMRAVDSETIPTQEALEILYEVVRQRDVPPEDVVRAPLWQMKDLRMAAIKFAHDNRFTVSRLVDLERRLEAPVTYAGPKGPVTRTITGQLDVLLYDPPDGAVIVDFKSSWATPPEPVEIPPEERRPEDDLKGISYHGLFQLHLYGWLVLRNFPNVEYVTLREFYVRRTQVRAATIRRHQLDSIERDLAVIAEAFDLAMMDGPPSFPYEFEKLGRWRPQPGRHCSFCHGSRLCPISEDVRIEAGGSITSKAMAERAAAELVVAERIRHVLREACKSWVESVGQPIKVRWSKGRRVIGWYRTKRGRRFGEYTPDASDRGTHAADAQLEQAMRDATKRARKRRPRRANQRQRVA